MCSENKKAAVTRGSSLDISMPGTNGLEVRRAVRDELAEAKILIMRQQDTKSLLSSAIQAGANGCVDKSRLGTELLSSIEGIVGTALTCDIVNRD